MKAIFLQANYLLKLSIKFCRAGNEVGRHFFSLSFAILLMAGLFITSLQASPFIAFVDKTEIEAGGSFRLTLEYQEQTSEQPDFSPLEKDFTILSQKTSTQSTYVNGAYQGKTRFILEIEPKNETKELMIPAIKLGKYETSSIRVTQSNKATSRGQKENNKEIGLFVTVDRPEVYVNGEVILHIEIKTPLSLQNGTINKPEIPDAIMETLSEDNLREVVEDGIKYFVFTRSYAIFPSKPGLMTVPSLTFKGLTADLRMKSDPFSGFFSSGKRVTARSSPIEVTVKDVPASYPKDVPFLPVKNFLVVESLDDDAKFAVNKATTRRFEIKAKGVLASFLPNVAQPTVENVQIYAETGNKIQKNIDGDFESSAKFSHVYMPIAPGKIKVPEQKIYWWDVDADELRTATIRALEVDVVGGRAIPSPDQEKIPEESPQLLDNGERKEEAVANNQTSSFGLWHLLSLLFLILWLATLVLFLRRKNSKNEAINEDGFLKTLKTHIKNIMLACDSHDAKRAYRALLTFREWAKRHNQVESFDREVGEKLRELEIALFEKDGQADKKAVLLELKNQIRGLQLTSPDKTQLLPLYPQ